MKHEIIVISALVMLSFPTLSLASDYSTFQKDSVEAYGYYKKALSLTSKPDTQPESIAAVGKFLSSWQALVRKYKNDVPEPFAVIQNYPVLIEMPLTIGQQALGELKSGDLKIAHATLEEIRYLLWKMRTDAGLETLSDKVNDFHEVMEVVLDKMHEDESIEHFRKVGQRYGAWMEIKWEEQARVGIFTAERDTFEKVMADGRKSIAELRTKLAGDDVEAAKAAGNKVKQAYKGLFFLDSAS